MKTTTFISRWLAGGLLLGLLLGSRGAAGQTVGASTNSLLGGTAGTNPPACLPQGDIGNTAPTTINLDFTCRCFEPDALTKLNSLKQGDLYRLRILHINPLLYKISVGVKDTSKISGFTFPTFASVGLSDLSTLAAGLTPVSIATKAVATKPEMKNASYELFSTKKLADDENNQEKDAKKLIDDYAGKVQEEVGTLTAINGDIDKVMLYYGTRLANAWLDYFYLASLRPLLPTAADIGAALKSLDALRSRLTQLRQRAETANMAYVQATSPPAVAKTIADDAGLKAGDDKVKAAYKKLTEDLTKVEASIAADKVQALLKALTDAVNNSVLEYVSLPQQFTQQQTRLGIRIEPRGTDNTLQSYYTQLAYPIDHQVYWGVSTGLFVSFLHNEAYSAKAQTAGGTTTYTLVAENPGKVEFGTSAMLRVGRQFGRSDFGYQFGFGPALAVGTKVRPRLLVGVGFSGGSLHRVLLDGGLALGYVDQLSTAYDLTTGYATAPDNAVVSTLKANFYVGLHYLFTK